MISRPSDFLMTLVTPTVRAGPLACTRLSSLLEQEEENRLRATMPRAEMEVQMVKVNGRARLTWDLLGICIIAYIHPLCIANEISGLTIYRLAV